MASADQPRKLTPRQWRDPAVLLASGFGSGFLNPAPGTWGTLAGVVIWWFALSGLAWLLQLAAVAVTVGVGIALGAYLSRRYGVQDDPAIVIDEFAGVWLALLAVPAHPLPVAAAFLAFRCFDVWKPGPVGWADRRGGGIGLMLDDLIAGAFAGIVLQLAFWAIGWPDPLPAP